MEKDNLTAKEIFDEIREMSKETAYIEEALKQLQTVKSIEGPSPDLGAKAKAESIAKVVEEREKTLRKTLEFYEKMYNDIQTPNWRTMKEIQAMFVNNMAYINDADISSDDKFAALNYVTDKIAELSEKVISSKSV